MEVRLEAEVTVRLRPALMHARAPDRRRPDARGSCFLRAVPALVHLPVRKTESDSGAYLAKRAAAFDKCCAARSARQDHEWLPKPYDRFDGFSGPQSSRPGPPELVQYDVAGRGTYGRCVGGGCEVWHDHFPMSAGGGTAGAAGGW